MASQLDPIFACRELFDADRCHDAKAQQTLKRADTLLALAAKERARRVTLQHKRDRIEAQQAETGNAGEVATFDVFSSSIIHEVRIRLEAAAEASDEMQGGTFDPLWGWKSNTLGDEMARLLYSPGGYADGTPGYAAALGRYRRLQRKAKEGRAATLMQRGARRLFARRKDEAIKREGVRKVAAMRVLVRLQARFRALRARRAHQAKQDELRWRSIRRRSTIMIQRWYKREQMKRKQASLEVASILSESNNFFKSFKASAGESVVLDEETAAERAEARWELMRGGSVTVALAVCRMFRQKASAAKCIQGANRRMLKDRQQAYMAMIIPIQRLLRRSVKAYMLRKDDREARVAYNSIELKLQATVIQRAYRKYSTSLMSALYAHAQRRHL